jgi:phage shock protein PspC (stress-responsive transcriptional regulator)
MLAGVCGGLGASTPLPGWFWRALLLMCLFYWGVGGLAYLILWISIPDGTDPPQPTTAWTWAVTAIFLIIILFALLMPIFY